MTEDEKKIYKDLQARRDSLVTLRNFLLHDSWMFWMYPSFLSLIFGNKHYKRLKEIDDQIDVLDLQIYRLDKAGA
jgi:predicted CoA-binding protein